MSYDTGGRTVAEKDNSDCAAGGKPAVMGRSGEPASFLGAEGEGGTFLYSAGTTGTLGAALPSSWLNISTTEAVCFLPDDDDDLDRFPEEEKTPEREATEKRFWRVFPVGSAGGASVAEQVGRVMVVLAVTERERLDDDKGAAVTVVVDEQLLSSGEEGREEVEGFECELGFVRVAEEVVV
jgi:hypothetical protein